MLRSDIADRLDLLNRVVSEEIDMRRAEHEVARCGNLGSVDAGV